MPSRNFPDWIDAYLGYTAASEAPEAFHRWTAIATIAGALRRQVHLNMGLFKWYPNFFICFVSPPGIVSKTTTMDLGMNLLARVPGIRFGPSIVTWQALHMAFSQAREDYPDGTGGFIPMSALTIASSEFGNLIQPGDKAIMNLLTDLWDGRRQSTKMTKKDGEETIANPWAQLIACTTPSWIADNFDHYFIGGGFASRTLFVYADHKRRLVPYPDLELSPAHIALGDQLVSDLEIISSTVGEYRLSNSARMWGSQWYERHNTGDNRLREDPRFAGYFARKQTHLHKTAMVLAASRGSDLVIHGRDLRRAHEWITQLESDMLESFAGMNREKVTDQMAIVLGAIRDHRRIARDDLYRILITQMGYTTFVECLTGLAQGGMISLRQEAQSIIISYEAGNVERNLRQKSGNSSKAI
jgi:hypothetical protein